MRYLNMPFDFSVGTLCFWSADGDVNYTKLGEVSDTCTISNKARKKLVNLFEHGWKANGPLRRLSLKRLHYYLTKGMKKYVN